MNYTEAYKALRGYGIPSDEARRLLDGAELTTGSSNSDILVTFSSDDGFVFIEPVKEDR